MMRNIRLDDVLCGREGNYILPFYWQHGDHTHTIPTEVQRIYDSGVRAFCVESRPHKDFCGDGWWRDMDIIIAEAKKRDMKVWILDDDHFPTGHANGGIEKKYPELGQRVIRERHVDVPGPMQDAAFLLKTDFKDAVLLGAYAVQRRHDAEEFCFGEPVDLMKNVVGNRIFWSVPDGFWRVYMYWHTCTGGKKDYIDMINPDSVRVLIDEVYEAHWAHYADEFGKTIAGFFSDEPCFGNDAGLSWDDFYNAWIGRKNMALPWNERVRSMMTETLGYDPMPFLHALWFEDEKRSELRFAYMDAVTLLYDECFTSQLAGWCQKHGVEYIGHIIEDKRSHSRLGCSAGHFFRSLRAQSMSGIDVVLHQITPGIPDATHVCVCATNSADPEFFDYTLAKLGASLAHLTPHMKGRAMCEIFGAYGWAEDSVMQKRLMDHMLVRGINHFVPHAFTTMFPDPDCPPHFGVEGLDPSFEAFGALMKYTNQICHILCGTEHIASAAILYDAEGEWCSSCCTSMSVGEPARALYDKHLDYEIVPMDMLEDASMESGAMYINGVRLGCLIVPAADHLPQKLIAMLTQLRKKGLPVLFVNAQPENLGFDGEIVSLSELPARVEALGLRDIAVEGEYQHLRVYHARRDESDMFFFVNESGAVAVDTWVQLPASGVYARLDLINDVRVRGCAPDGRVDLKLVPGQSQMIVFADNDLPAEYGTEPLKTLAPVYTIELAPFDRMTDFEPWMETKQLFNVTGPLGKMDFSGKMRYRFEFEAGKERRLFIDLGRVGQNAALKINGRDCGIRICPPYRFEITDAVQEGLNTAEVVVSNTLVQRDPDRFSSYLPIAPSGLLGPVKLERERNS